jgi:hypothetical protein
LGTYNSTDAQLLGERLTEAGPQDRASSTSKFQAPARCISRQERVPRDNFGVVDPFMLSTGLRLQDLDNLVYPSTSATVSMRVPLPIPTFSHPALAPGISPE